MGLDSPFTLGLCFAEVCNAASTARSKRTQPSGSASESAGGVSAIKKLATDKARERLEKARAAMRAVDDSNNFRDFVSAWTDLLMALHGIYTVLEQGAKDNPQSRQWYGGKKNERRKDPLLSYLHQARNADEHGLEPVAAQVGNSLKIGLPGESVYVESATFGAEQTNIKFKPVDGKYPTVVLRGPHAILVAVKDDRFNQTFDPPKAHLGQSIEDPSPEIVGNLGLQYHETLISEAEALVK